jgi:predicted membrane protein
VIGVFVVATLVGLLIGCLMRLGKRHWTACLAASGSAFLGTAIVGFLVLNYLVT